MSPASTYDATMDPSGQHMTAKPKLLSFILQINASPSVISQLIYLVACTNQHGFFYLPFYQRVSRPLYNTNILPFSSRLQFHNRCFDRSYKSRCFYSFLLFTSRMSTRLPSPSYDTRSTLLLTPPPRLTFTDHWCFHPGVSTLSHHFHPPLVFPPWCFYSLFLPLRSRNFSSQHIHLLAAN